LPGDAAAPVTEPFLVFEDPEKEFMTRKAATKSKNLPFIDFGAGIRVNSDLGWSYYRLAKDRERDPSPIPDVNSYDHRIDQVESFIIHHA
jgi:hypothetical protein